MSKNYCPFKYQSCRPGCMAFVEADHPDTGETIGFCLMMAASASWVNFSFGEDTASIRYVTLPAEGADENDG